VVLHLRPARDHVAGESKPAIEMGHFSHWPRRISLWGHRLQGRWSSSKPKALRGRAGKLKGRKGRRGSLEKAAGNERVFIPSRPTAWQMGRVRRHTGHGRR
jgi:hypothetical protein